MVPGERDSWTREPVPWWVGALVAMIVTLSLTFSAFSLGESLSIRQDLAEAERRIEDLELEIRTAREEFKDDLTDARIEFQGSVHNAEATYQAWAANIKAQLARIEERTANNGP